jgi:hypothetical protein
MAEVNDLVDAYFRCDKPGERLIAEAFTRGEQRGIERALAALCEAYDGERQTRFRLGLSFAIDLVQSLESLRATLAGELSGNSGEVGSSSGSAKLLDAMRLIVEVALSPDTGAKSRWSAGLRSIRSRFRRSSEVESKP